MPVANQDATQAMMAPVADCPVEPDAPRYATQVCEL